MLSSKMEVSLIDDTVVWSRTKKITCTTSTGCVFRGIISAMFRQDLSIGICRRKMEVNFERATLNTRYIRGGGEKTTMPTTTQTRSSDSLEGASQMPTLAKASGDAALQRGDTRTQEACALSESFLKLQQLLNRQTAERLTRMQHHGHRLSPHGLLQGEHIDLHISALPQHTFDDLLVASRLRHVGAQRQRVAKLHSNF